MSIYYRFMSENELQDLLQSEEPIRQKDGSFFHLLSKLTPSMILPRAANYNYSIDQFMRQLYTGDRDISFLGIHQLAKIMIGTMTQDYLVAFDGINPTHLNLGWYGYNIDDERVLLEYGISTLHRTYIKAIYAGNFVNWTEVYSIPITHNEVEK